MSIKSRGGGAQVITRSSLPLDPAAQQPNSVDPRPGLGIRSQQRAQSRRHLPIFDALFIEKAHSDMCRSARRGLSCAGGCSRALTPRAIAINSAVEVSLAVAPS